MTAKLVVLPYEILWFWFEPVDAYHVDVVSQRARSFCTRGRLRSMNAVVDAE